MNKKPLFFKIIPIFMLLASIVLVGFTEVNTDNLYHYQWGLKNNGNFLVDKGILADNYQASSYNKQEFDKFFKNTKNEMEKIKINEYDTGVSYATESIDTNWEAGYIYFKNKGATQDTIIAIIDSGIDINHFELSDSIWKNTREYPNGIDDDRNGYVDDINGFNFLDNNAKVFTDAIADIHGTHAAGTIVARHDNGGIKGIAYDSHIKIMPLKILDKNGDGSMFAFANAVKYAKDNGATICNVSLGIYNYNSMLDEIIKNSQDMLCVVSAGNGGMYKGYSLDNNDVYPAKLPYDNVITVGNLSFDGTKFDSSNYGSCVDVFAPGTMILSTIPNGNFGYITGTSFSAPFVTATCAMIHSLYPSIPISKYKKIISDGVTKLPTLENYSSNGGMLNIYNSLVLADTLSRG